MTFSRDQWIRLLLFTAIIMLTIANAAFAQGLTGGGGGGAGLLQPVWTWVTTNILPVIIIAAVVGLGVALLAMSFLSPSRSQYLHRCGYHCLCSYHFRSDAGRQLTYGWFNGS